MDTTHRSVHDFAKDVKRLLPLALEKPTQYHAAISSELYPAFPLETPMGEVSVRLLGRDQAEVRGAFTVYRVTYPNERIHLEKVGGAWQRAPGIVAFERRDGRWLCGPSPAAQRFEKVALPVIAAFLESPEPTQARDAAQAIRLAWELPHYHHDVDKLDDLITEMAEARRSIVATIATTLSELRRIDASLPDALATTPEAA